jgi:hypothetical protein
LSKAVDTQEDIIDLLDNEYLYASAGNVTEWSANAEVEVIDDVYPENDRKMKAAELSNIVTINNPPPVLSILDTILDVYPDCDVACAQLLCSRHGIAPEACATDLTAAIVAIVLEEMS